MQCGEWVSKRNVAEWAEILVWCYVHPIILHALWSVSKQINLVLMSYLLS